MPGSKGLVGIIGFSAVTSGVFMAFGLQTSAVQAVTIIAKRGSVTSADPWDRAWSDIPAVESAVSAPAGRSIRTVAVRAVQDGANLYLLVEWHDSTKDRSFGEPSQLWNQADLLRDSVEVHLAPFNAGDTCRTFGWAGRKAERWAWHSHWQRDLELNQLATVHERYPQDYVDYFPFEDDQKYVPARFLGNENALEPAVSSVQKRPAPKAGGLPTTQGISGSGRWSKDHWRVLFKCPLQDWRTPLTNGVLMNIQLWDGGRREQGLSRGVSLPYFMRMQD